MDIEKIILSLSEMTLLATRYRNALLRANALEEDNDSDDNAIDRAWDLFEEARAELAPPDDADDDDDFYEPPDPQDERDRREYEAGKAEGELRRAERRIYGNDLADAFHAQDDLNRYNAGED